MIDNTLKPFGAVPNQRQLEHLEMGRKAFFHFGVNTFSDLEWGLGTEIENIFNPTKLDCRQWIRTAKAAGCKLAILTTKHHDGFCLWPSKYTEHSIKNSPYKDGHGDIVREFTDACHEYGVKVGIYMSPWDRNAPNWGDDAYNDYYVAQLTEVLTNYGPIHEVWWDGAGSEDTPYDWGRWAYTVRNYQPEAAIYGSFGATPYVDIRWAGNENGHAGDPIYPTIDPHYLVVENTTQLNKGAIDGERFIPAEAIVSIRPGWFYHEDQTKDVKSIDRLVRIWYQSVGRGCMSLLNFPPNQEGLIPDIDAHNAIAANELVEKMLSVNLASEGIATCSGAINQMYEAQNILIDNKDCVFAAKEDAKNVVIHIKLPEKKTFNTFTIKEKVEYGVRVSGYRIYASIDGEWVMIKDKKAIGYLWAEYFDDVTTDEIKIEFYEFSAPPIIESFGLHYMNINPFEGHTLSTSTENLVKNISYEERFAVVSLGGIYPFNTIVINNYRGDYLYNIEIFDGTQYHLVKEISRPEEKEIIRFDEPIDGSYQFRIGGCRILDESLQVEVYNL